MYARNEEKEDYSEESGFTLMTPASVHIIRAYHADADLQSCNN